jgi:hypothetical protein
MHPEIELTYVPDDVEVATLAECEAVISRRLRTFMEVGRALARIRDEQLYRLTHATFEDYCRDRWEIGRAHAYRLVAAAEVAEEMSPRGDTPVAEAQARALARLTPAQRAEVAEIVAGEGGFVAVSARRVAEIARQVAPPERTPLAPVPVRRAAAVLDLAEKLTRDSEHNDGRAAAVISVVAGWCRDPDDLDRPRVLARVLARAEEEAARSDPRLALTCPVCERTPAAVS